MNKSDEINLLRETARKLGRDSYTGEALAALLPSIEADILNDVCPEIDLRKIQTECRIERERCAAECAAMRQKAKDDAAEEMARLRKELKDERDQLATLMESKASQIRRGW